MKLFFAAIVVFFLSIISFELCAQNSIQDASLHTTGKKHLYIDVHKLGPGKVTFKEVAKAHAKDLAVQGKYGTGFLNYWVDEKNGFVYCLVSASDTASIRKTHAEAHGLLPDHIYSVTAGAEAAMMNQKNLFLDVHYVGAGKVSAKDVEGAHQKDLAVQQKHGVNLINYWFDEKEGIIMCLAQAKDSNALKQTHKEAHGLLPAFVLKVKQGE